MRGIPSFKGSRLRLESIAMHGISHKQEVEPFILFNFDQLLKVSFDFLFPHPGDHQQFTLLVVWVQGWDQVEEIFLADIAANLDSNWITDSSEKLNMSSIELAGPLTNPNHMSGQT